MYSKKDHILLVLISILIIISLLILYGDRIKYEPFKELSVEEVNCISIYNLLSEDIIVLKDENLKDTIRLLNTLRLYERYAGLIEERDHRVEVKIVYKDGSHEYIGISNAFLLYQGNLYRIDANVYKKMIDYFK